MRTVVSLLVAVLLLAGVALAKDVTAEIKVSGMTCGACAGGLQKTLERQKGVRKAEVSYEKRLATIVYDDAQTNEKELREAINKTGFKAEPSKTQEKK
ncbi:MAG: heavy-metal-associated domain-containing protein [Terriglobales bacterium]